MCKTNGHACSAWVLTLAAFLPMAGVYLLHFLAAPPGWRFTGFLQYDQASYMAFARAVFDHGNGVSYGLPFSPDPETPRIYFQPHVMLLGWLLKITGMNPGILYVLFGVVFGILMFRVAVALLSETGVRPDGWAGCLTYIAFLWGGGMLWAAVLRLLVGNDDWSYDALRAAPFEGDPGGGFWFLNLGRNVWYSVETFYHTIFFLAVLSLLRTKYAWTFAWAALLSISHPFSGLQLLLVLLAFAFVETIAVAGERPPWWFPLGLGILLLVHLGYYLVALGQWSEEHRILHRQWLVDFSVPLASCLLAYEIVAFAAVKGVLGPPRILGSRHIRLFAVWFLVSFALVEHDLFLKPVQPAHFTRGYVWTPLFLMGAPFIHQVLQQILFGKAGMRARIGAVGLTVAFCMDNILWFSRSVADLWLRPVSQVHVINRPIFVPKEAYDLFASLNKLTSRDSLFVSSDLGISYLSTAYTSGLSWVSHGYSTPHVRERTNDIVAFLSRGTEPDDWSGRPILVAIDMHQPPAGSVDVLAARGFVLRMSIGRYQLFSRP